MFKKILLCTDLSPASDTLTQCVGQMKTLGLEEIILAHVLYVANTPGLEGRLAELARPVLENQKAILEQQSMRVTVEMPVGKPAYALNDLAEKHDVSVIVIGSHGRGIAASIALGSVSSKLLQVTEWPVLLSRVKLLQEEIVEEEKCVAACRDLFSHILHPTDFSDTAERAFSYLETVVKAQKCPVTLLHVQEQDSKRQLSQKKEELRRLALARLERMKVRLESIGASKVIVKDEHGDPADVIVKTRKAQDCSLIVMGSQGKGFAKEIMLGSVAHRVARQAEAPVLFVPAVR